MGSFTTSDFTCFGNAKEKKHFVDLNLFHETLSFPVFSQVPSFGSFLTLQPLLLLLSSILHLKPLPLEIGFTSFIHTLPTHYTYPHMSTTNSCLYFWLNFSCELQIPMSNRFLHVFVEPNRSQTKYVPQSYSPNPSFKSVLLSVSYPG